MAKKVIYYGLERCDYIYHLASSLGSMHHVLVCDNSFAGDLFTSVSKENSEVYSWLGMDFARNISVNQDLDNYDYVVIYAGERMEKEYLSYENAFFLFMPQCSWQGLQSLKEAKMPLDAIKHVIIIRDHFSRSLTAKSIGTLLDIPPSEIVGFISLEDYGAYLSLTHSGRQNPKCLSADIREALVYILATLEETDRKTANLMLNHSWDILKKRLKKAEKQKKQQTKTARKRGEKA